jgi:hypothetical protein
MWDFAKSHRAMRKNMLFEEREGLRFEVAVVERDITAELNVDRYNLGKDVAIGFSIPTEP